MSLTYIWKIKGPDMNPWGTAVRIGLDDKLYRFKTTPWNLFER